MKIIEKAKKYANLEGLFKNPLFYFGVACFVLFGSIYFACNSSANFSAKSAFFNSFFDSEKEGNLFFGQQNQLALETPDLKIVQDNSLGGVSTTQVLTPKVLGDILGSTTENRKYVIEYVIQPGDTLQSIAKAHGILQNTLLWANSLTSSSKLKVGQSLTILPADGIIYVVKSGDTISQLSQKYKAKTDEIVAFNELSDEGDIFIGDVLILPNGVMPPKTTGPVHMQAPLADNFFIFPTQGKVSQGLHYYNAIDVANKCGTPVYAAASGTVQRIKYGYNLGGGNYITILHSGGIVTYYGHLMTIFIKPGDKVSVGDRIALMGGGTGTKGDGISTGCHLHFGVTGAKNPLSKYPVGSTINLK